MANEIGGISVKLSADVDTTGTVKGYAQIEQASQKIQKEFKETEAAAKSSNMAIESSTNKAVTAANKATKAFKMQKGSLTQLGYQIQDVAVMSQFGADKFVILGTQGSQIASLFGPGGAVFGAFLAIGAAVLGVASKMNAAGKETEDLEGKLKSLAETSKLTAAEQEYLNQINSKSTEEKKSRIKALEEEIKKQEGLISSLNESASGLGRMAKASRQRIESGSIDEMNAKLVKLRAELSYINKLVSGDREALDVEVESDDKGVKDRVESIRAGLQREQELYQTWRQTRAGITAGIISDEQAQLIEADVVAQQRINAQYDQTKARLKEERQLLLENQTLTAEEKAARQAEIDAAEREAKAVKDSLLLQQEQEFQSDMTAIEERAAQARIKLAEMEKNAKLGYMSSMFGSLSSLMNTESRKLFEIGKAAAVANAVVDGYAAVSKTMSSVPYPFNVPLAAAQAAASAAQVSGIMSTKFGSAGTGQSYSGGQVVNNTSSAQTQQPEQRNISIALTGSGFSGGDIRGLISAINEELGDGVTLSATGG